VHFEKQRPVQDRLNRNHGGIETLDVGPPAESARSFSRHEAVHRPRKIHSHGFLDENVEPHFQKAGNPPLRARPSERPPLAASARSAQLL